MKTTKRDIQPPYQVIPSPQKDWKQTSVDKLYESMSGKKKIFQGVVHVIHVNYDAVSNDTCFYSVSLDDHQQSHHSFSFLSLLLFTSLNAVRSKQGGLINERLACLPEVLSS